MKRRFTFTLNLLLLILTSSWGLAQSTTNMPNSDGGEITVPVTNEILFFDAGGETGDIPNYQISRVTFTPRENEIIEVLFQTIDLQGGALIKIFDGAKTLNSDEDWSGDITYSIPTGAKKSLSGNKANETIHSYSADGKLTICFQNANGTGKGWKASVKSITRPPVTEEPAVGDINFPWNAKIYTISSPINFYDDGGKAGNISEQFTGQVTFKPTTANAKIKVEFSKLELFNTSTVGKNDILKVYSGTEPTEANLLATVLKEPTPITIKSTAADGSLTLTLVSTTGISKPGFEAIVSEFTPQPMTFSAIELSQHTIGTVSAGDINQPILAINVKTSNDQSPISVKSMAFNTASTYAQVTKASVYYTKNSNAFSSSCKVGEANISANDFIVTLTTPQELIEGSNHFWLTYDINPQAQSALTIDAACSKVSLSSGDEIVAEPNPEGNRTIKNEYISTIGSFERTIYGTWNFTHTPNPYGSGYKPESGDQTITFKPGTTGKVIELAFTDFDIYYASTSYGTKAKFEIYSGTGPGGELLWKLDDAASKATGPNTLLRSTAIDGSLTVVFNANTSSSYYTAKGWHATVSEYQPTNMRIKSINAFQGNTTVIKPGATNQEIIGIAIATEGNLNPITISEVLVNLKGCSNLVKRALLFNTETSNIFSVNNLIGDKENPTNETTIALTTPLELKEGTTYLWIAYDIVDAPEAEQVIDASLASIKAGTETLIPQIGDPEGNRITKNIYEFEGGTKTVKVTNSLMFYDNGGAANNYSTEAKGTVTFTPNNGQVIKLVFKAFNTRYNDYFYVYNGSTTNEQLAKLSGSTLPETILSTASDGSITVKFEPNNSYNSGWEIEVQSYTPEPLTISQVKSAEVSSNYLYRGARNELMLRIDVHVAGDKGEINLNQFKIATNGTTQVNDIANASIFFTDTISTFSPDALYGSSNTILESTLINGSTSITKSGIYKFWVAYNISKDAANGNKVQACLTSAMAQNTSTNITETKTATRTIKGGFSGTYTIGSSSNARFQSIASAVDAMKNGIDGKVIFEIEPGTYNELVKIPQIEGASQENTITIKSQSGDYNDVTIEVNTYSAPAYGEEEFGLFTINGADFITIEGITIKTDKTAFPSVVQVKNSSRNVTVRNCKIESPQSTSYSAGDIRLVSVEGANTPFANSDFFTLEGSVLVGGYTGAYISGTGYVALQKQKGCTIAGNNFSNQGSISIYMTKEHSGVIEGNTINTTGTTASTYKAIDAICMGNTVIRNNRINVRTNGAANGIYIRKRDDNETLSGRNRVYNNEIIVATTSSSEVHGIYISSPISDIDIAFNSISIAKAGTGRNAAIYMLGSGTPANTTISNNLLQNNSGGYTYYFNKADYTQGIQFSNNALYSSSSTKFAYAGSEVPLFADWVAMTKAGNSLQEQASFVSESTLELALVGSLKSAIPVDFVTTDINGISRNTTEPTIGAHEYAEVAIPNMATGYPKFTGLTHCSTKITVKSTESGQAYLLVKEQTANNPELEEVTQSTSIPLTKGVEASVFVDNLKSETSYVAYIVLQNTKGQLSEVIASSTFKTANLPTETSTFESATSEGEAFTDGTASFTGFSVTNILNGIGAANNKAAKVNATEANVTITNSSIGLILNGFYLYSDTEVTLTAKQKEKERGTKQLAATNGKWVFINLKDFKEITTVALSGTGNILVDNFSGTPQPITFSIEDKTVNQGESFTIEAEISGGAIPYSYSWVNSSNEVLSTTSELNRVASYTGEYTLIVTDAWGSTATRSCIVTVQGKPAAATFDDLYLAPESHWWGSKQSMSSTFLSGSYNFTNTLVELLGSWGGFGYSNRTSTNFNNFIIDQFNSTVGQGVNNSKNYAVVYTKGDQTKVTVTSNPDGTTISGFFITNSAWVKSVAESGTGIETQEDPTGRAPFKKGDWYKITATADNGSSLDFYLADYRAENPTDHYFINTWQWVDLRDLGKVKWVKFSADGSRKNEYGSTIPFYFCMDNFGGKRAERLVPEQLITPSTTESIDVSQWVTFNSSATTIYKIADEWLSNKASVQLNNQALTVTGESVGLDTIVISATQKGETEFIRIPLKVATMYNLSYAATNGGAITGTMEQLVEEGQNGLEVEAIANVGYHFVKWSDGLTTAKRTDLNITSNISVTAEFAINTYTLTYISGKNGTISGATVQIINHGSNGTEVEAIPTKGFQFIRWSDGVNSAKRTETNVTEDLTATAEFAEIEVKRYTLTYSAGVGGTILGQSPQTVTEGGNGIQIEATPNLGHHFVQWSDGITANPRTDANVTADITVEAEFAINTYSLAYTAGANGTLTGEANQTVNHGANGTAVEAVPATGYHFVKWSDGVTANPRTDANVTADITVVAEFAINTYSLAYTAGANGTLTGEANQTVNHGANGTAVEAVPTTGYHFVKWSDGVTANPRTDANVTADISVEAEFAINTYSLAYTTGAHGTLTGEANQTVNHGANGTAVEAVPAAGYHFVKWSDGITANPRTDANATADITVEAEFAVNTYSLTYTAGTNGTLTGEANQTVNHGANGTAVEAVPAAGYHFVQWSDGVTANPRTDANVTADISVEAEFAINTYTLTFSVRAKDNQPVASATIAINGGEISTNLEGTATISLANGDYAYTVTVDGFQSVTGTVTINGEDTNVDIVMIPVGVNDTPIASISVYPNPFRDNLVIGNAASVNRIIITNLMGQQVINISNNGNQEVNIDTSTLNPGIYLVTTYTANGKRTVKKVVKE